EDDLGVLARADRTLDADRPARPERRAEAVVQRQRLGEDLLLDLAIETDRDLPLVVALTQRDEGILFRELLERLAQLRDLPRLERAHDASQRGAGNRRGALPITPISGPNPIADPRRPQPVQSDDLPGTRRMRRRRRSGREAIDAGDPLLDLFQLTECVAATD